MDGDQDERAYHYGVIGRAIAEIDAAGERVSLEELAGRLGMSPAHFQRVFTQWVGVSPKRYQQYLALGHARRLLAERFTVLEAAHASGLSGPGRLHDLFLRWEAMTPGDYAKGGAGLTIHWGWFDSPFGPALVMGTEKGLCGMGFAAEMGAEAAFADLTGRWPKARFVEDPMRLKPWVDSAFGTTGGLSETPLYLIGAPFQIKVWEALLKIPPASLVSYRQLAGHLGIPRAARAVGSAVGANHIAWLIPCHRVIRDDGGCSNYRWGVERKLALRAWEAGRAEAAR